ncbi:hypothetical protein HL653_03735 [Sphingomonas sp. AP4-R1]|nr:hypothetical protein HL653_03735 [Sphingomonas sp. AP4-R1]
MVRTWLQSRLAAALADQDAADRYGREREDDYDKAAAEEWVCRKTKSSDATGDQQRFGEMLKALLDEDDFYRIGVRNEKRFEREVRTYLRKLIKMTKTNSGFEKLSRYQ